MQSSKSPRRSLAPITLFAVLLCVAFSGTSDAAGAHRTWTQFDASEQGAFYFDQTTIKRRGHGLQVWAAWEPARTYYADGQRVQRVEVMHVMDCAHRNVVYARQHFFDADGRQIARLLSKERMSIASDSLGAVVFEAFCK